MENPIEQATLLEKQLEGQSPEAGLRYLTTQFPGQVVFSTSLGKEDQLLTHFICEAGLPIRIFTLDTGRLFPETYNLLSQTQRHYGCQISVYCPESGDVEAYVNQHGINAFYESLALRKSCCQIRKVAPLKRALKGAGIWVTGLRAGQSENRQDMQLVAWDPAFQLFKYNPLINWTLDEIEQAVNTLHIPCNPLHDKGFVSIGCAPCTRAISPGEPLRAGRWWWEEHDKKECGLHAR